jgi:hypothetical protein
MKKLVTFRMPRKSLVNLALGREVVYIAPDKTFSCRCKVIGYDGDDAILEPLEEPRPM